MSEPAIAPPTRHPTNFEMRWNLRMTFEAGNGPATRPTGRSDCNRVAMAGLEAAQGESHAAVFRLENTQTILSTMTPHSKQIIARSKIKTGKDQEPWSP